MKRLCAFALWAFALPQAGHAEKTERLGAFYQLLFAAGCKKHPDHIPGRNKLMLAQAGFSEAEYPSMIEKLKKAGALIVEDGFIVGKIGVCA